MNLVVNTKVKRFFPKGLSLGGWIFLSIFWHVSLADDRLHYLAVVNGSEPYQIVTDTRMLHGGLISDALQAMLINSGYQMETVLRPYRRINLELQTGILTGWVFYGSPAWQPNTYADKGIYSKTPLLTFTYLLLGDDGASKDLLMIRGEKIILIEGFNYPPRLHRWAKLQQNQFVYAPTYRQAIKMLQQGRASYVLMEDVRADYFERSLTPKAPFVRVDASLVAPGGKLFLLYDKRLPETVINDLDRRLAVLAKSGELAKILAKYQ